MHSKHLEFLSFQIVYHILAGIILHMFLTFAFSPAASQLFKASETFLGMVRDIPLRFKKILHSCWVYLQCRNIWFTFSNAFPQRKQLEHKVIPLLFKYLESEQSCNTFLMSTRIYFVDHSSNRTFSNCAQDLCSSGEG